MYAIVGNHRKAFETPAPRHLRCDIRTKWPFREEAGAKVEDRIWLQELPNKPSKHEGKIIMSITSFEKSTEDPADTRDSDLKDPQPHATPPGQGRALKGEAKPREETTSQNHLFSHRPKNPFCPVCQPAKMLAPHAHNTEFRKHCVQAVWGPGYHGSYHNPRFAGLWSRRRKGCVGCQGCLLKVLVRPKPRTLSHASEASQHFLKVEGSKGNIYSDNAPGLVSAAKSFTVRLGTSRAFVKDKKSVIKREIRAILGAIRFRSEALAVCG